MSYGMKGAEYCPRNEAICVARYFDGKCVMMDKCPKRVPPAPAEPWWGFAF